jgi:urease subunit gamma/beta
VGFAGLVDGPLDAPGAKDRALAKARACGFADSGDADGADASGGDGSPGGPAAPGDPAAAVHALVRALAERTDRARDGVTT